MLGNTFYGYDLIALNEVTMLLRLVLATVCGGLLGFERTKKRRPPASGPIFWFVRGRAPR